MGKDRHRVGISIRESNPSRAFVRTLSHGERPPLGVEDNLWHFGPSTLGRPTGLAPVRTPSRGVMLLLHHGLHQAGAPTWTCTTNPLLRTERCNTLTPWEQLALSDLASVAGLAPARLGLKARLLDRLCIHGRRMAAGVGLAPTPPVLQTGVQTFYTIQRKGNGRPGW